MARAQKRDLIAPSVTERELEIYPGVRAHVSMRRAGSEHRRPMFRWSEFFDELDNDRRPGSAIAGSLPVSTTTIGPSAMRSYQTVTGFDNVVRLPFPNHAVHEIDDEEVFDDDDDRGFGSVLRGSTLLLGVAYVAATVMTGVAFATAFFPPPSDEWVHTADVRHVVAPAAPSLRKPSEPSQSQSVDSSRIAQFATPNAYSTPRPMMIDEAKIQKAEVAETQPTQTRIDFSWLHAPTDDQPMRPLFAHSATTSDAPEPTPQRTAEVAGSESTAEPTALRAAGIIVIPAPGMSTAPSFQIATFPMTSPIAARYMESPTGFWRP